LIVSKIHNYIFTVIRTDISFNNPFKSKFLVLNCERIY